MQPLLAPSNHLQPPPTTPTTAIQADAPDFSRIPPDDVVGVTIILLTCCYRAQEFLRVGYYVNNEYVDATRREEPPPEPEVGALARHILADKPRVTKFPIEWDAARQGSAMDAGDGGGGGAEGPAASAEPMASGGFGGGAQEAAGAAATPSAGGGEMQVDG
jgi:histone chaperone ASF1